MPLTFIVPGWHAATIAQGSASTPEGQAGDAPDRSVPTCHLERIDVRWRMERDAPPCWRTAVWSVLCEGLAGGAATITTVPAANDWGDLTGRVPPSAPLLRADPVSLLADRDTAILRPPLSLGLSDTEAASLVASLNAFIVDDGLALHAPTPRDWYLSGPALPALALASPDALAFGSYDPMGAQAGDVGATPTASAAGYPAQASARRRLRTLQSELEMLLHTHPVNRERQADGRLVVSGLYFWGASGDWPGASLPRVPGTPDGVIGDDAFVRAAARACGVPLVDRQAGAVPASSRPAGEHRLIVDLSLLTPWLQADAPALDAARSAFIEHWLSPMADHGSSLAWHAPTAHAAGSGVQIIAEAGWRHRALAAPGGPASRLIGRLRRLTERLTERLAERRPGAA